MTRASKTKRRGHVQAQSRETALRRSLAIQLRFGHVASVAAFIFLRHRSKPNPPMPVAKSGSAEGSGVSLLLVVMSLNAAQYRSGLDAQQRPVTASAMLSSKIQLI